MRLSGCICVIDDHVYNLLDHLCFFINCKVIFFILVYFRIILTQITIYPYSDLSIFIYAYLFLSKIKFANFIKNLLIPIKHSHHTIKVIRVRNISKLTESTLWMINVDNQWKGRWTKFTVLNWLIVICSDNMWIFLPPLERL